MSKTPELLPSPHDGSKVKFCDECDSGCHRIIGNGIEIDLLPTIRQGDSLENRRAICAERWNTRVYPEEVERCLQALSYRDCQIEKLTKELSEAKNQLDIVQRGAGILAQSLETIVKLADISPEEAAVTDPGSIADALTEAFRKKFITPEVQAAIDRSKKEKVSLMPGGIGVCPNCLEDIHDEITHCCHCGQRLDWIEE